MLHESSQDCLLQPSSRKIHVRSKLELKFLPVGVDRNTKLLKVAWRHTQLATLRIREWIQYRPWLSQTARAFFARSWKSLWCIVCPKDKIEKANKFALRPGNHDIELRDSDGRTLFRERVAITVGHTTELKVG